MVVHRGCNIARLLGFGPAMTRHDRAFPLSFGVGHDCLIELSLGQAKRASNGCSALQNESHVTDADKNRTRSDDFDFNTYAGSDYGDYNRDQPAPPVENHDQKHDLAPQDRVQRIENAARNCRLTD